MNTFDLITIVGPTASGKTSLACNLAYRIDSEIISGDSRQIYRGMDIGTGKDLSDYVVNNVPVKYHLIDIHDAGYKYNIFEFQHDFHEAYSEIKSKNKLPILCGGSGLYIESVLKGYSLTNVPENQMLRKSLEHKSLQELTLILASLKELHNTTDLDTAQRAIRAIEIEEYKKHNNISSHEYPPLQSLIVGVDVDREVRRKRITDRLKKRLKEGMIEEVQSLLQQGLSPDDLIYYGLEYKYVTQYLLSELNYQEMFNQLEIAIHQFAKRQMTWFRGMEKRGLKIHWLDEKLSDDKKTSQIIGLLNL